MATMTTEDPMTGPATRRVSRRQRWAGCALLLGGLTLGVAEVLHPEVDGDGASALARSLATRPRIWTTWSFLLMASALLQLPGVLAWRNRVVAGKGAVLVGIGTTTLTVALVALFAFGQSHAQGVAYAGAAPVDPAVLAAFSRGDAAVSVGITLALALFGFHLGWPLVLVGLARAGAVPVPLAIIGSAAALGSFFADPLGRFAGPAAFVVLAAVLVAISLPLLRGAEPRLHRTTSAPAPTGR